VRYEKKTSMGAAAEGGGDKEEEEEREILLAPQAAFRAFSFQYWSAILYWDWVTFTPSDEA